MKAIILAAGYATRLYPLTIDTPKALLTVGGKAILDHLMEKFECAREIDEVHIVSNSRFYSAFDEWVRTSQKKYPAKKLFAWNDGTDSNETRLGAIGDIRFVLDRAGIDDDLFIAASDNLLSESLKGYFDDFRAHGKDLLLAGKMPDQEERKRYAVLELDENRRVTGLEEKPENPKSDIVAFAEYIYRRDTLPLIRTYLDEGNNPDSPGHLPEWLFRRKDVRAYLYEGECVDIGTVKMYNEVCRAFENGKARK